MLLRALLASNYGFVIAGETETGKTTLLNALAQETAGGAIAAVERAGELRLPPDAARLTVRWAVGDAPGAILRRSDSTRRWLVSPLACCSTKCAPTSRKRSRRCSASTIRPAKSGSCAPRRITSGCKARWGCWRAAPICRAGRGARSRALRAAALHRHGRADSGAASVVQHRRVAVARRHRLPRLRHAAALRGRSRPADRDAARPLARLSSRLRVLKPMLVERTTNSPSLPEVGVGGQRLLRSCLYRISMDFIQSHPAPHVTFAGT